MNSLALELKIRAIVEGLANVSTLTKELLSIGTSATEASSTAVSAAKRTEAAYDGLGERSFAEIQAEIVKAKNAYEALATSGKTSAAEQSTAASSTVKHIDELNEALQASAAAAAEAEAAAIAAANKTEAAYSNLGIRSFSKIQAEIDKVKASYEHLANSGQLSAEEQSTANAALTKRIAALNAEIRSTATTATETGNVAVSSAQKMDAAYSTLGTRSFAEIRAEIAKVRTAYNVLATSGQLSAGEQSAALGATTKKITELNQEMRGVAPATKDAERGMSGLTSSTHSLLAGLVSVTAAITSTKNASEAAMELDRMRNAMQATIGSAEGAAKEYAFVRAESDRLGLSLQKTAQDYTSLTAATKGTTLAGEPTRRIFTAVAEASAVLGLSAENTSGALLAVSQMVSKGTVSAEELRGQLGERLPGAFQIAARAMGVSTAELGKMLETGSIATDVFLPKFAAELKKTFNDGLPGAVGSARAEFARLSNTIFETAAAVGQSGLNQGLAEAANILRGQLSDPAVQESLKSLGRVIGELAVAAAKMSHELSVIAEVAVGSYLFEKIATSVIKMTTVTSGAVVPFAGLAAAIRGVASALLSIAPYIAALVVFYETTKAVANAVVEHAIATRKLSDAEKQRVTDLQEQNAVLRASITSHQQYSDVQVKTAQQVLALSPAQLAAYKEQLEAKKQLEFQEYVLAANMRDLEALRAQEAASLGKSKQEIEGHANASKAAAAEAAKWGAKAAETRMAIDELSTASKVAALAVSDKLTPEAAKLIVMFEEMIKKSPDVSAALKKMFESFNPNSLSSVKALMEALDSIGKKGEASAKQIHDALEKEINSLDYKGLINLQTMLDQTGEKGTVAAGFVVQALGKVSDAAKEAADDFVRLSKQMTALSTSEVNVAKAHLDMVKAEIEVRRAKLDVTEKQNTYLREGTEVARLELDLARTNLEISKAKSIEAKLQFEQAVAAKNVLIAQQRQLNAEIDIELHRGDELYVQKARQAQENTAAAQQQLEVATRAVNKQEEAVLKLEEQGIQQEFLVDQAKAAEEETRRIKDNMNDASKATDKAAKSMNDLADASKNVKAPPDPNTNNTNNRQTPNSKKEENEFIAETVDSLTRKFQDAGLSYGGARVTAERLVNKQMYVDVNAEIEKVKADIKANANGATNGLKGVGANAGGSGGFAFDFNQMGKVSSQSLLNQLPSSSSSMSAPNTSSAPSKTIQVNFTDGSGKSIPVTVDAANEQALLNMLKKAKGVSN
ncbi:tape measure protein [Undibacterium danionis]|uniref:Tape measure protein n=1 Tax=Undibacterium danionis TaxID=1812100 RepID=A0ABV6ICX9_9BURK